MTRPFEKIYSKMLSCISIFTATAPIQRKAGAFLIIQQKSTLLQAVPRTRTHNRKKSFIFTKNDSFSLPLLDCFSKFSRTPNYDL